MRRQLLIMLGALLVLGGLLRIIPPAKGQFFPPALPGTFGDISTPSVPPPPGATRIYTKNGTGCALSPLNVETCTGSGGGGSVTSVNGFTGAVKTTSPWSPAIVAPPTLAGGTWTFDNGGGNGTDADVTGGIELSSVSGNNLKVLYQTQPGSAGSAFTLNAHISAVCGLGSNTNANYGVAIGDSGAKWVVFSIQQNFITQNSNWTNSTTFASAPFTGVGIAGGLIDLWFKVVYDATPNFTYSISAVGVPGDTATYNQQTQVGAGTFLATTPRKVGFYAYSGTGGAPCNVVLNHWNVTQP